MGDKIELQEEELEKVMGGYDFKIYDYDFTEKTSIKTLTELYPWVLELYPELELAVKYNLTVESVCKIKNWDYATLQDLLNKGTEIYNEDGTLKNQEVTQ